MSEEQEPTGGPVDLSAEVLLEAAPDAMLVVGSEGRIVYANARAERLFGYTRAELVGAEVELLIPERFHQGHGHHRETFVRQPRVRPMGGGLDLVARRRDGTEFPADISLSPIETPGGRVVLSVVRDITDRKRAEEQRVELGREQAARKEAEAANRVKDDFLRVLSHELRTPLNAILGWAHMLRSKGLDEASRERAVATIIRNANVQTQLVSDILDLSRVTSGKLQLSRTAVSLSQVIEAAVDTVRPSAEARSMQIALALDGSLGPVFGEAARLQQVVWNLLANSIKFTPSGGRIDVELRRVGAQAEIVVRDNGEGIEQEFLPHVFDAFRQQDSSSSRAHGGLGLGLAIVKRLVELHGGEVCAESAGPGRGALFRLHLPLMPAPAGTVSAEGSTVGPPLAGRLLGGISVLVVDDDPDGREMVRELLVAQGAEVTVAGSAEDGMRLFADDPPDVLLIDLAMPVEDGCSLVQRIRSLPAELGGRIPAIALTAHAHPEDRARALAAGFQVHLPKPVNPVELRGVILTCVGGAGARS